MEVPLSPVGREDIHRLESILLFATLFRPEVIEMIKDPAERLTWVDSLAVAAGAIAREKAGMSVTEIANELGRTEQAIRRHLKGESKAGQLVRETYELIKQGKLEDVLKSIELIEESGKLREELERLKEENERLKAVLEELKVEISELMEKIAKLKEKL
ncbi:MAG: hypothetical protein ABWW66_07175 [Archaeoglobaceae archaeon]